MPSVSDIWGGDGNDVLKGGDGPNLLDGGPGADVMNGGGDIDIVDYSYRVAPVTANLDGSAGDDGQAGEGDTIGADVEGLFGGSGNDTLTGNAADGVIFGGDGADTIRDAGGRDFIDSGDGSDAIFAFDGASDTISCEGGPDVVSADPIDDVGSDCGYVSRQPPAPPTPPTAVETTLASIPTMLAADSVLFNFTASQAGSTFVCTLDGKSSGCTSPFQASGLSQGTHHFTVQAIGANGTRDATPPTSTFTVDTVKPTIAIKQPKARCVGRAGEKLRISGGDANAVGHVTVKLGTKVLANTSARSATARVTRPLLRKHGRRLRISIADTAGNTARKSVYLRRC
jgi:Ca2+-binding RTX toxin-like protein